MFAFIAIFIPSIIGVKIIDYIEKGISLKQSIYHYSILILLSSVFNNLVSYILFHLKSQIIVYLNTLPIYFCKYVIISIVINILLAFIFIIIEKNVSFELEVESINERKSTWKTKKNISK